MNLRDQVRARLHRLGRRASLCHGGELSTCPDDGLTCQPRDCPTNRLTKAAQQEDPVPTPAPAPINGAESQEESNTMRLELRETLARVRAQSGAAPSDSKMFRLKTRAKTRMAQNADRRIKWLEEDAQAEESA